MILQIPEKYKLNIEIPKTNQVRFETKTMRYHKLYDFYRATYTFRANLHSVIAWMSRNSLLKSGVVFEISLSKGLSVCL